MEIDKDKWITIAHENIARYMDRGGENEGDIPELLEGPQLLNTVGIALNVHFSDPTSWTEEELEEAEYGHLCFFRGESRKAIDIIVDKIAEESKQPDRQLITVLPLQLYSNGKLYSLSLFRFKAKSKWKFIDNVGRVYKDFKDWKENNVLPPGKVCYPLEGHLQRNCKGYVQTRCKSTPFGSSQAKVMKTADVSTGVIGIVGAVGTLFLTGGVALPFVVAGVGSAIYTTTRSVYHLVDRGTHGQTLNPFDNHENFSLWLGIGANVISFGAMGATIRLSTLAFQGKNVSQGLRALVNIVNGTSIGVNSIAVANSLAYMALHFDDMSPIDVLMQVASVAFWAKSIISYKPATKIVKEIHNQVLTGYSSSMGHSQEDFNRFRVKFNNDKQLVKFYFRYLKQGLDPAQVSDVLVEIYQMGAGAQFFSVDPAQMTININGHTFTMEFLMTIRSCNRQTVFNLLAGLNEKETEIFNKLRSQIQDDVALFYLIAEVSSNFNIKPEDSCRSLINFWESIDDVSNKIPPAIKINKDSTITFGNGFTLNISQISEFSSKESAMILIKENLLKLDAENSSKFKSLRKHFNDDEKLVAWMSAANKMKIGNIIEALIELKSMESEDLQIFDLVKLDESFSECGLLIVNEIIKVSIFFLAQLDQKLLNEFMQMIRKTEIEDGKLLNFHEKIGHYRVQSFHNHSKAQEWFEKMTKTQTRITSRYGQLQAEDLNKLYHLKPLISRFQKESQLIIINFAFSLNPKTLREFCACCDFTCSYLSNAMEKMSVEQFKIYKASQQENPKSIRMWREYAVINDLKSNCRTSKLEFAKIKMNVTRNRMFDKNPIAIKDGLCDKDLVKSIITKVRNNELIRFESDAQAIAQVYKRSKHDSRKFIDRANFIIKDSKSKSSVWRSQEGVTRKVEFLDANGKVELTKRFGNVYMSSFVEYDQK